MIESTFKQLGGVVLWLNASLSIFLLGIIGLSGNPCGGARGVLGVLILGSI